MTQIPITEDRAWGPALIEPELQIQPHPDMPERVVLCFFREVVERIAREATVVVGLDWAHAIHEIYRIEIDGRPSA